MLSPDKGTRDLLPYLIERPGETTLVAASDEGQVRSIPDSGLPPPPLANPMPDPAPPGAGPVIQASPLPSEQPPTSQGSSLQGSGHTSDILSGTDHSLFYGDVDQSGSDTGSAHQAAHMSGGSTAPTSAGAAPSPASIDEIGRDDETSGDQGFAGQKLLHPISGDPSLSGPAPTPGVPLAVPDGDDIHVVQTAFVDQDADVLINGWIGESKVRLFVENDADMYQDVDIELDRDGNGRMLLRLNQSMIIDQETEIDLDIYENNGVLYVDLYLKNNVDLEQDTELDLMMDGWRGRSYVFVNNDLDVRQHTDIDVDIDDDLEEKFAIKVAIGVKQSIDVDQDADIDLSHSHNGLGVDVDATQVALIDQDTTLKIDFSVV